MLPLAVEENFSQNVGTHWSPSVVRKKPDSSLVMILLPLALVTFLLIIGLYLCRWKLKQLLKSRNKSVMTDLELHRNRVSPPSTGARSKFMLT